MFSPNRKGDNRILTPREENSFPRGEAARGRIFTSRGVRILLSPARLGESTILMTLLIAWQLISRNFYRAGENKILSRYVPGENLLSKIILSRSPLEKLREITEFLHHAGENENSLDFWLLVKFWEWILSWMKIEDIVQICSYIFSLLQMKMSQLTILFISFLQIFKWKLWIKWIIQENIFYIWVWPSVY